MSIISQDNINLITIQEFEFLCDEYKPSIVFAFKQHILLNFTICKKNWSAEKKQYREWLKELKTFIYLP